MLILATEPHLLAAAEEISRRVAIAPPNLATVVFLCGEAPALAHEVTRQNQQCRRAINALARHNAIVDACEPADFHGCFTGDCPHDNVNDCVASRSRGPKGNHARFLIWRVTATPRPAMPRPPFRVTLKTTSSRTSSTTNRPNSGATCPPAVANRRCTSLGQIVSNIIPNYTPRRNRSRSPATTTHGTRLFCGTPRWNYWPFARRFWPVTTTK